MSQTAYNSISSEAFAGMKADSRFDHVESFIANQAISFGRACGAEAADVYGVHQPIRDVGVLLFDADFVASNSIIITVNGVSTAAVVYATSHANTSALVLAAIQGLSTVSSASISDGATAREFTIESSGELITVAEAITGGASQATGAVTYSSDDIFRGIALHSHPQGAGNNVSLAAYAQNDAVNVLRQGTAWVETGVAVNADETAYVDIAGGIGKFTNVSSGNLATGGKFRSTVAAAGLAKLEINLP